MKDLLPITRHPYVVPLAPCEIRQVRQEISETIQLEIEEAWSEL